MGLLQEAEIGRLGSRFSLNFRPREQAVYLSPLGRIYDRPVKLGIGLRLGEQVYILPFAGLDGVNHFSEVEQEFLMDGVEFKVRDCRLGLEFSCKFSAPFYPGDHKTSIAPFYYIDLSVRSFIHGRDNFTPLNGEWLFSLEGLENLKTKDISLLYDIESKLDRNCWYYSEECPPEARTAFSENTFSGNIKVCPLNPESSWDFSAVDTNPCLAKPFSLENPGQVLKETLIIAGYQAGSVFKVHKQEKSFLYTKYFPDIDSVVDFARNERKTLLHKAALFNDTVNGATIGEAAKSMLACGFHNYLTNTWWVRDDSNDWFFVWEGWCGFISTLDVEYNNAWFSLLYWPELLEKQLKVWYSHLQPEGFPSHDVGIALEAITQVYPHHMPVEESCNLILLTYALWRLRGYRQWHDHLNELVRVVGYLLASDTTGNGYPNLGVANTVDDAAATVQFAKEQTYLAVKVLAALTAFAEMAKDIPDAFTASLQPLLAKSVEMMARIRKTMDSEAWLGDHYAVCLPQSGKDLQDVWTGRQIQDADMIGWAAYSLYTSNGLLWLLATGVKPDLDYNRLTIDLRNAVTQSLTPFGCTHSSFDRSNIWLSQNLWRDQIAAYLGVDYSVLSERYWRFLEWENTQGRGGCFVDTYGWNWLSYYPRGATAFGLLASSIKMQVDQAKRVVTLNPVRWPCRFPLVILADWGNEVIPWIDSWAEAGEFLWRLEGRLPDKWRINFPFGREAALTGDNHGKTMENVSREETG